MEVKRIKGAVDRHGERFLRRVFRPAELSLCRERSNPWPCLAVRWAAKEAVLKALGVGLGKAPLTDIEIGKDSRGRPHVELSGVLLRLMEEEGITGIEISLSHEKELAVALAVAFLP
ncbi:MAG: holo-ACP synthase [Firmicutes bacterium]|nr:holo-ACP synthase [Bacillota bacterium]